MVDYIIRTRVVKVEKKSQVLRARKIGDNDIEREIVDLGWFVLFEHSYEYLFIGHEEPTDLFAGKKVRIRLESDDE